VAESVRLHHLRDFSYAFFMATAKFRASNAYLLNGSVIFSGSLLIMITENHRTGTNALKLYKNYVLQTCWIWLSSTVHSQTLNSSFSEAGPHGAAHQRRQSSSKAGAYNTAVKPRALAPPMSEAEGRL
jgi:hypothetical protein